MMDVETFDRARLWHFRARLESVRDCDTIETLADTGYGGRHQAAIRLAGINSPENGTPEGDAATAWMVDTLSRWPISHAWPLRVVSLQRERVVSEVRSFERFVGSIYLIAVNGQLVSLSDLAVTAGHAVRAT
ncbi:MAG: hypothetical protein M3464_06050 [Chloroflexota bacterium]|nr:hypothetical protein [Chloroflexota bacterium]